jgi:hypothetical protein
MFAGGILLSILLKVKDNTVYKETPTYEQANIINERS